MRTQTVTYHDGDTACHGYMAVPADVSGPRPVVLIAHDWTGCNEFAKNQAEEMAKLGFVGFALDIFGEGRLGSDNDEKAKLIAPFLDDRKYLLRRMLAAFDCVSAQPDVDSNKMAAIGFCFGGLCVLDLARNVAPLRGIVSFHGILVPPDDVSEKPMTTKLLVLHGYNDPMVPMEQVSGFCQEMDKRGADWQLMMYGQTMHAFTNPVANDKDLGTVYSERAAARGFQMMRTFFNELFA